MPGFFISNFGKIELDNFRNNECVTDEWQIDGVFCARNTLNKFLHDKVFAEGKECFIIMEGVLLNKAELLVDYDVETVEELVSSMYLQHGRIFFDGFRGSFSGALYDKAREEWVIFTNHYGDNPVFYYTDNTGCFAFGSQVNYVLSALAKEGVDLTLNMDAVYMMLSYGFMVDESTYAGEIKRLLPGSFAVVNKFGEVKVDSYYRPKEYLQDLSDWSDEEIIQEMDRLFQRAVLRGLSKDVEYGYGHLCDLSGGLDSRMTTWVAHELGFAPILNVAFSQSQYLDQLIAQEIAAYLHNEFIFKSLDDANFIFDAKQIVEMNFGLSLVAGITGAESFMRRLNFNSLGMGHTGQMGDVVVGSFLGSADELDDFRPGGNYSNKRVERIAPPMTRGYVDREQYLLETRGFLGALSSHFVRRNYTEVASPFLDVDFFNFCLSIPIEKRANHKLYKRWILEKHPEAAQFVWEKEGAKITSTKLSRLLKKCMRGAKRMLTKMRGGTPISSMNPFDVWYKSNADIRKWIDEELVRERPTCPSYVRAEIDSYIRDSSTLEKMQALTTLLAIDYYFGDASYGGLGAGMEQPSKEN
ncbi:asparagine synthase-related protein [Adlercreutzia sp. R7]|uniref:asparagine synthase (glutamine-hydrolyzing) n=1 Tax=Adlercreutzia wanghongyangiae TaxID=3111451 RepID=A0ABU6IGZ2_9ACTN|nr:asparagine synthase-related protein [Adlercreutzia sp. R7]